MVKTGTKQDVGALAGIQDLSKSTVVLVVEDESVVREITARVLESAGYKVLESSGPKHALCIADTHRGNIDLLLTDIVMPGMNGVDLAARLRQWQPDMVTVFMSGYADGDVLRKGLAGSAMHIQKPFTVNFLLSRIAEALKAVKADRVQLCSTAVPELPAKPPLGAVDPIEPPPNSLPK